MSLESIALWALGLIGSTSAHMGVPELEKMGWSVKAFWVKSGSSYVTELTYKDPNNLCKNSEKGNVFFPRVVHGAHQIKLGKSVSYTWSDLDFSEIKSFYGAPVIKCKDLIEAKTEELSWKIISYSYYFSNLQGLPYWGDQLDLQRFFDVSLNLISIGSLIVIALFSFMFYFGKITKSLLFSTVLSPLFTMIYFLFNSPGEIGLNISMLMSHKIADAGLWIGITFLFFGYYKEKLISFNVYLCNLISTILGVLVIAIGGSGDVVQFGTSLPIPSVTFCLMFSLYSILFKRAVSPNPLTHVNFLRVVSIMAFVVVSFNDLLILNGYMSGFLTLPIGLVFGLGFFSLSVNEHIQEAYRERDHLRENLEVEVLIKTKELTEKTKNLESAYSELRLAQSEVVNSAKLAGLGTMAAGIAHEINNSLNYVNGSIRPLEKRILALPASNEEQKRISEFFTMIKEGLKQTFEIIQSLRNYTGLNKAAIDEVSLLRVVKNVMTLLKSKIENDVKVTVEVDENHKILGSIVGLNQILMNLFTNAIDAIKDSKTQRLKDVPQLKISSQLKGDILSLRIQDSGVGMPESVVQKMFDPFFTTKEVGKGTGLGMHIVKKELDRCGASIRVDSQVGRGTTIEIDFPLNNSERKAA